MRLQGLGGRVCEASKPLAVLGNVGGGVWVAAVDPGGVLGDVAEKFDGDVVTFGQVGVATEVGKIVTFLFRHVVAVGDPGRSNAFPPVLTSHGMRVGLGDRVADLVVVLDGIFGFVVGAILAFRALAQAQQRGIEVMFFGFGVNLEQDGELPPHCAKPFGVGAVDLVEGGEHSPLFVVLIQDNLGDVHDFNTSLSRCASAACS